MKHLVYIGRFLLLRSDHSWNFHNTKLMSCLAMPNAWHCTTKCANEIDLSVKCKWASQMSRFKLTSANESNIKCQKLDSKTQSKGPQMISRPDFIIIFQNLFHINERLSLESILSVFGQAVIAQLRIALFQ